MRLQWTLSHNRRGRLERNHFADQKGGQGFRESRIQSRNLRTRFSVNLLAEIRFASCRMRQPQTYFSDPLCVPCRFTEQEMVCKH